MLNGCCDFHYLYSYSAISADADAGYDVKVPLGSWAATPEAAGDCELTRPEGGSIKFYAAMR
jgi:hypothetical protein